MNWDPTLSIIIIVLCTCWVLRTYIIYKYGGPRDGNTD
jgi:hypothetical protein